MTSALMRICFVSGDMVDWQVESTMERPGRATASGMAEATRAWAASGMVLSVTLSAKWFQLLQPTGGVRLKGSLGSLLRLASGQAKAERRSASEQKGWRFTQWGSLAMAGRIVY